MYSAYRASLVAQMVKEFTCNVGDLDSISGWEDPLEEGMATQVAKGQGPVLGPCILQYSCLENPCGQRSLVGCSPRGLEESDMTEQLLFHFSLSCIGE